MRRPLSDCDNKGGHCPHDSVNQPAYYKARKYVVCCHCSQTWEIVGVVNIPEGHGRHYPNPPVEWPDAVKPKKATGARKGAKGGAKVEKE